ncbi:hypothetical protein niasHT_007980 [Heterodera trifolii]|uniref:Uncharacterized protein n=1 Tax=Heterodera trifolii TaxID=157864 RepID=A0ABD2M022_9BILA
MSPISSWDGMSLRPEAPANDSVQSIRLGEYQHHQGKKERLEVNINPTTWARVSANMLQRERGSTSMIVPVAWIIAMQRQLKQEFRSLDNIDMGRIWTVYEGMDGGGRYHLIYYNSFHWTRDFYRKDSSSPFIPLMRIRGEAADYCLFIYNCKNWGIDGQQQPIFPNGMSIDKNGMGPANAVLPSDIPMDVLVGRQANKVKRKRGGFLTRKRLEEQGFVLSPPRSRASTRASAGDAKAQ